MKYYQKAMKILVYRDKIYKKLTENSVHNWILDGKLMRDECDLDDVYDFFIDTTMLKRNNTA